MAILGLGEAVQLLSKTAATLEVEVITYTCPPLPAFTNSSWLSRLAVATPLGFEVHRRRAALGDHNVSHGVDSLRIYRLAHFGILY